ncbi:hypothetical protein ACFYZI_31680 [Streptomyces griseorubiginosus]|uniref:hypothetical protein n=1 Tax=Streptomyces griseorubiginosus TaxID=67304 RepID=UPI00369FE5F8
MTPTGRSAPTCRARSRHRTGRGRLARAVRYAGRLLCWSLGTAMASAATDLLLAPHAQWWSYAWPAPWILTCAFALTWAVLRACEKHAAHSTTDAEDPHRDEWEHAA